MATIDNALSQSQADKSSQTLGYRTAVVPGFNPDPSMIRVGSDYFLITSSFEYFPGIPIYHSTDLVNWTLINHVLTRRSQLDLRTVEAGGGIFAPTIREHRGRIYVTCCQMHKSDSLGGYKKMVVPRGFYLSTDDIFKHDSFTEPIWLDNAGIDQDLFFDDATGKVWMSTADFITDRKILDKKAGVPIVVVTREIDLATGRSLTHDVVNCYSSVGNGVAEGPHLFRRGGRYYLSVAIGGTDICHQQWIYRSDSPLGPWEAAPSPINPMVFNDDHPEVRLTGHMDLCPGDGGIDGDHWWACFLGVRPQWDVEHKVHDSQLGRETFLCPVEWQDGWPIVNRGQKVKINGLGETGLVRLPDEFVEEYSYNPSEQLPLGWYHARTPLKPDYNLHERPGSIALYGNCYRLKDDECVAMHLRKQQSHEGIWKCSLEFVPERINEEAGTTVWWSKHCHATLGIRGIGDGEGKCTARAIVFKSPDPTLPEEVIFKEIVLPFHHEKIDFMIKAERLSYEFYYKSLDNGDYERIGSMATDALTRARIFDSFCTGTMLGIYALGEPNHPCLQPAYFNSISWSGRRGGPSEWSPSGRNIPAQPQRAVLDFKFD